ncbi:MAG: hypothetical protein ACR2L8_17585 [Solirubrobacteraceae bacterium]
MRILTTNDFVGSFHPQATSYGRLPGAAALQATVDDLRTQAGGGFWIDTGDLAQGSALGALSDGVWPFLSLRELSIDIGVAGNHELDWGAAHLRRWSAELPFGLLAANLRLNLPATRMLSADGRAVGVIGLSLPAMPAMHPGVTAHPDPVGMVVEHATELRTQGARHVVLALHDGVDALPGAEAVTVVTERMQALCDHLRGSVDLVLGGHTLTCYAGSLAGVPFLQPWAFGSQVGVADLHDDGRVALRLVDVGSARPWTVVGAGAQAALEALRPSSASTSRSSSAPRSEQSSVTSRRRRVSINAARSQAPLTSRSSAMARADSSLSSRSASRRSASSSLPCATRSSATFARTSAWSAGSPAVAQPAARPPPAPISPWRRARCRGACDTPRRDAATRSAA